MPAKEVPANPVILRWAREDANLSHEEAAAKAGVSALKPRGEKPGVSSSRRIELWENGDEPLTLGQLKKLAHAYRRPLMTFFLSSPPIKQSILADFRTVGDKPSVRSTPEFSALVRQLEALQRELKGLLQEASHQALPFIGSMSISDGIFNVARDMRRVLSFSFSKQKALRDSNSLFTAIRNHAEEQGIFIVKKGDLGSHHSKVSPDEFRGLAISDETAPLVCINPNDANAAQLFTLVHELAHLWTGRTGISNYDSVKKNTIDGANDSEHFCNAVAAEFLVPQAVLESHWQMLCHGDNILNDISTTAKSFKVSRFVIARRLNDLQMIDDATYWSIFKTLQKDWVAHQHALKAKGGSPPYQIQVKSRLGRRLLSTVIGAALEGRLSYNNASRMLNLKIDHFKDFASV